MFFSLVEPDLVETRTCQASINNAKVRRLDGSTDQDYGGLVLLYNSMPFSKHGFSSIKSRASENVLQHNVVTAHVFRVI